jgi:hypothetical protein
MEVAAVATVLGDPIAASRLRAGANSIRRLRGPRDRTRQINREAKRAAVGRRGRVSLWRPMCDERQKRPPETEGLFLRLGCEQQGIALAPSGIRRVRCLRFRYILRVDSNDTTAAPMSGHHHPQRLILAHAEFRLQNHDDELAGREVIIDQDDFM